MLAVSMFAAGSAILACSHGSRPAAAGALRREARWQDLFATIPDVMVTLRPQALRRDPLCGALLERSIELARMQSPVVAATRAFDAIGDAEEVVIGTSASETARQDDFVVVVRGVRGDIDPVTLVDSEGRALWSPGPSGAVRELLRRFDQTDSIARDASGKTERGREATPSPDDASLFELPGRTWGIAVGRARQRAREAFSQPGGSAKSPPIDLRFLASVRIAGPVLVAGARALQEDGGLAAVGRRLRALTLALPAEGFPEENKRPASGRHVQLTLSYPEEHAAESAEAALHRVIAAFANVEAAKRGRVNVPTERVPTSEPIKTTTVELEWLALAEVVRTTGVTDDPAGASLVTVSAALPQPLIDVLLHMSSLRWAASAQVRPSPEGRVRLPATP